MALRTTFLAFPIVSSLCFKAYRCEDLDLDDGKDAQVMTADYAVVCTDENGQFTAEYQAIRYLAGFGIVAYPVCVPIMYVFLLFKARHTVRRGEETALSRAISFLTDEFEPAFFFWELVRLAEC